MKRFALAALALIAWTWWSYEKYLRDHPPPDKP